MVDGIVFGVSSSFNSLLLSSSDLLASAVGVGFF